MHDESAEPGMIPDFSVDCTKQTRCHHPDSNRNEPPPFRAGGKSRKLSAGTHLLTLAAHLPAPPG